MSVKDFKVELVDIITKYEKMGLSNNDIQSSVIDVLKHKTDYDDDFIMLVNETSNDQDYLKNKIINLEVQLKTINENLSQVKNQNQVMRETIDDLNKPTFIKDVDKTITNVGKEIETGLLSFGNFVNKFMDELINEANEKPSEMDV